MKMKSLVLLSFVVPFCSVKAQTGKELQQVFSFVLDSLVSKQTSQTSFIIPAQTVHYNNDYRLTVYDFDEPCNREDVEKINEAKGKSRSMNIARYFTAKTNVQLADTFPGYYASFNERSLRSCVCYFTTPIFLKGKKFCLVAFEIDKGDRKDVLLKKVNDHWTISKIIYTRYSPIIMVASK